MNCVVSDALYLCHSTLVPSLYDIAQKSLLMPISSFFSNNELD
jgi:hypothetical protein